MDAIAQSESIECCAHVAALCAAAERSKVPVAALTLPPCVQPLNRAQHCAHTSALRSEAPRAMLALRRVCSHGVVRNIGCRAHAAVLNSTE